MKKGLNHGLQIPLPSAPLPPTIEPPIEEPTSSCSTALNSPIILSNLHGICVYQLPFPGVLSEKDQREKLSVVLKKYCRNFEIRFDAVPNNSPDATNPQVGGRRFQPLPLIRRALIVTQNLANVEPLKAELNQLTMVGCQLKASSASPEDLNTFLASRSSKTSALMAAKAGPPPPPQPPKIAEFPTTSAVKRPQNLLRLPLISPPAAAVKAIFDAQNHGLPDPFSKNASRTLYVKHLETNTTEEDLKLRYGKFGHILDIEVKNRNTLSPYAFIQFTDIESVSNAIKQFVAQKSSSHHWWGNTIVSNRLWVGLLPPKCSEHYLASKVRVVLPSPEHEITKVDFDPAFNEAVLVFTGHEAAQIVFNKIKMGQIKFQPESSNMTIAYKHVHVDFCSEKLHSYFVDRLFHKNVDVGAIDAACILPSPPEQPKLPALNPPKKSSPSPPPDPSTEPIERRHSMSFHSMKPTSSSSIQMNSLARNIQLHSQPTSITAQHEEEVEQQQLQHKNRQHKSARIHHQQPHQERSTATTKRNRSKSSSSSSSTSSDSSADTFEELMPRRKWRRHQQPSHSSRHAADEKARGTHERQKVQKLKKDARDPAPEKSSSWEKKHRNHTAEKSSERRRAEVGNRHSDRSGRSSRKAIERDQHEGRASREHKRSTNIREFQRLEKNDHRRKYKSKSEHRPSSSLLPPPPVPPKRLDRVEEKPKLKTVRSESSSSSSSSSSNSSCSSYSRSESQSDLCDEEKTPRNKASEMVENEKADESGSESATSISNYSDENEDYGSHNIIKDDTHPEMVPVSENEEKATDPEQEDVQMEASKPKLTTMESGVRTTPSSSKQPEKPVAAIQKDGSAVKPLMKMPPRSFEQLSSAGSIHRTDSISSECAHKKNETPTTETSSCSLTMRLRTMIAKTEKEKTTHTHHIPIIPLTASADYSPKDPRLSKARNNDNEENHVISLELPRFALHSKLPKRCQQLEGSHHPVQKDSQQKSEKQIKKEEHSHSTEDHQAVCGTPQSTTPSMVHKHELLHDPSVVEQKPLDRMVGEAQDNQTSIKSLTKASSLLNQLYDGLKVRRSALDLDKTTQGKETNITKIQAQLKQMVELFNTTTLEEWPNLVSRPPFHQQHSSNEAVYRHIGTESEVKMELDEQPSQLHTKMESPQSREHSSFSSTERSTVETPQLATQKVAVPAGSIDSHERRNTLPAKETTTMAKPKTLLPRPRASSSSVTQQSSETHELDYSSPKHESSPTKTVFVKPKMDKDEHSSPSATTSPHKLKKAPSASILKKPTTQNSEDEQHKSAINLQKNDQQKKASQPIATTKKILENKKMPEKEKETINKKEKDTKKDHKDVKMKSFDSKLPSASASGIAKKSSSKEEKHEIVSKPKSFSVGNKDQLKFIIKSKGTSEADADSADGKRKKKQRKKRDSSSNSSSDDSDNAIGGLFDVDLEEQRRMLEAIKSGKSYGMSMYDRVKRRSSQRPDDEKKKSIALEQLREKQAKKKKELNRIRLSSSSSDSDDSTKHSTNVQGENIHKEEASIKPSKAKYSDIDVDVDVEGDADDSSPNFNIQPEQRQLEKSANEQNMSSIIEQKTIGKPQIAPKKPMMMEKSVVEQKSSFESEHDGEQGGQEESDSTKHCSSSVDWNMSVSSDENDELPSREGDKIVQKLQAELNKCRSHSQSSQEDKDDFEEKLAHVIQVAKEGTTPHSSPVLSSSSSSSSTTSSSDEEEAQKAPRGFPTYKKYAPKKQITNLSLVDVFGAESDDEATNEPVKAIETTVQSNMETKTDSLKSAPEKQQLSTTTKSFSKSKDEKQKVPDDKKTDEKKLSTSSRFKASTSSTNKEKSAKASIEHKKLKRQSPVRTTSMDTTATTADKTAHHHKQQSSACLKRAANEDHQKSSEPLPKKRKSAPQKEAAETKKKAKRHQDTEHEEDRNKAKQSKMSEKSPIRGREKQQHKHEEKKPATAPITDGLDAIGLLGIVAAPVAGDEFVVIDSGKIGAPNIGESSSTLEAKKHPEKDESKTEESAKKDEKEKEIEENKRKEEEQQAELLRRMEQNEEEEAVAALKLQTTSTRRNSQDMEEAGTKGSIVSNFMKPVEHRHGWHKDAGEFDKEEEAKEEHMTAENKDGDDIATEKEAVLPLPDEHIAVERRPSNESIDAHMVGMGSGFVEVDAEVLKEQQEKEQIAEEEKRRQAEEAERQRKMEEAKKLEATVDFVVANGGGTTPESTSTATVPLKHSPIASASAEVQQQTVKIVPEQQEQKVLEQYKQQQLPSAPSAPEFPILREETQQVPPAIAKQHPHSIGVIVCEPSALKQIKPEAITTNAMPNMQTPSIYAYTHQMENKPQEIKQTIPAVQQLPKIVAPPSFVTTQQISSFYPRLEESATYSGPTTTTPSPFLPPPFEQQKPTLLNLQQQQQSNIEASSLQLHAPQPIEFPVKKSMPTNKQLPQKKSSIQQPQHPIQNVQTAQIQQQQKAQIQQHNQQQQQQQFWQNQMELQAQLVQQQQQQYQQQQQKLQAQQQPMPQVQLQQQIHKQAEHQQNQLLQQAKKQSLQSQHQQIQQQQQHQQVQQQQASKSAIAMEQQQQQRLQQQQQAQQLQMQQQQAQELAAVAALMQDPTMLQLYQRLMLTGGREQQSTHFQVPNLMTPAASNQLNTGAALAKWMQPNASAIGQSSAAVMNPAATMELLRLGLISNSPLALPTTPLPTTSQNQMAAATLEELYRQQCMAVTASPRLQQQQQLHSFQQSHAQQQQLQQTEQQQMQQLLQQHQAAQQTQQVQKPQQVVAPIFQSNQQPARQQQPTTHQLPTVSSQAQNYAMPKQIPQQQQQLLRQQAEQAQKVQRQNPQTAPTIWQGQLVMKNADTLVLMHRVCGNDRLVERMNQELVSPNEQGIPVLRITQRMRLEHSQMESLVRKMEQEANYIALICLPCGRDRADVVVQTEKLQNSFINYFSSKQAAGIASLPPNSSCVAHIFAPDEFSRSLLAKNAPEILRKVDSMKAGYLFVIVTNS